MEAIFCTCVLMSPTENILAASNVPCEHGNVLYWRFCFQSNNESWELIGREMVIAWQQGWRACETMRQT